MLIRQKKCTPRALPLLLAICLALLGAGCGKQDDPLSFYRSYVAAAAKGDWVSVWQGAARKTRLSLLLFAQVKVMVALKKAGKDPESFLREIDPAGSGARKTNPGELFVKAMHKLRSLGVKPWPMRLPHLYYGQVETAFAGPAAARLKPLGKTAGGLVHLVKEEGKWRFLALKQSRPQPKTKPR